MRRALAGGHIAHMPAGPGPGPLVGQVSNVTNSNDFASKDSRVFVGNLNTFVLVKEDVDRIFCRYGIVTGISMHKGYAFVQFNHPVEARRAVNNEQGRLYAGQNLDLNIVSEPKHRPPIKRNGGPGMGERRPAAQTSPVPVAVKRPRMDSNPSLQRSNLVTLSNSVSSSGGARPPTAVRPRPTATANTAATRAAAAAVKRAAATATRTAVSASSSSTSSTISLGPTVDVLICGVCKMQFTSLHSLAQHKKIPCRLRTSCQCQTNPPKQPEEVVQLDCGTCDARFDSAWALCQHCQKEHDMNIYKAKDGASDADKKATTPVRAIVKDEGEGKDDGIQNEKNKEEEAKSAKK